MNDVTRKLKSVTTMKFFQCATADSCLFQNKCHPSPQFMHFFLAMGRRRKEILFLAVYLVWTLSFVAQVLFCVLGPNSCVNKIFKQASLLSLFEDLLKTCPRILSLLCHIDFNPDGAEGEKLGFIEECKPCKSQPTLLDKVLPNVAVQCVGRCGQPLLGLYVWWLGPGWVPDAHPSHSVTPLLWRAGEEGKCPDSKAFCYRNYLVRWKAEAEEQTKLLFSAARQPIVLGCFWEAGLQHMQQLLWRDPCHQQLSPHCLLPLGFYIWAEYPFGQFGSPGPAVSLLKITPSTTGGRMLEKHYLGAWPKHFCVVNTQLQHYKRCSGENELQLCQTNAVQHNV